MIDMVSNSPVKTNSSIRAVLGPTNTGKTHFALERMMSHDSGVIGFPLRLLARENYDRLVLEKGKTKVALVTGEEKIIPRNAKYFVCTVESMPIDQTFDFLAVDEIQLCADPERGHIFTDRLLRARGRIETLFLGAETIRTVIGALVPKIKFESRPRLSELTYTGFKKMTRLPKRSAIVGFSIDDIYRIGELIRRQKGGTALVLGALSPRARNAQVAMYQNGEVDYLVATDAIGMGLNMDINHVALASVRKYDGKKVRKLSAAEVAQIAGRAGRYMRDGTFGTTADLKGLLPEIVESVQNHEFESLKSLCWRNSILDFSTLTSLKTSLNAPSSHPVLVKGRMGEDFHALQALSLKEDVLARATSKSRIRLLWDICQIPDFRKTLDETHQDLLSDVYAQLCDHSYLNEDWIARHLERLDKTDGDVDTLMTRISHVRTWTYISHHSDWVEDNNYWQSRARDIEDRLSDALHESLTKRFVDKRSAILTQSLDSKNSEVLAGIKKNGEVIVEGHLIGHLKGFRFIPDKTIESESKPLLLTAARKALKPEIKKRLRTMVSNQGRFSLQDDGQIFWQSDQSNPMPGEALGTLKKGDSLYSPDVIIKKEDLLEDKDKNDIEQAAVSWIEKHITETLYPLVGFDNPDVLSGPAAGIGFQLKENLGVIERDQVRELINTLDDDGRTQLRAQKVRLGPQNVFVRTLLKPAAVRLKAVLWNIWHGESLPALVPHDGAASVSSQGFDKKPDYALALGYPVCGPRAVRVDMLDRLISAIYDGSKDGKFQAKHEMAEWLGCPIDDLYAVLEALGHKKHIDPADVSSGEDTDKTADPNNKKDASEQEQCKVEVKDTSSEAGDSVNTGPKEEVAQKPELATFWLRQFTKGPKKQNKKPKKPEKSGSKKNKSKKIRDRNKEDRQKQQPLAHSPFSVLQDLKQGTDNE